jgi:hypothetical protein
LKAVELFGLLLPGLTRWHKTELIKLKRKLGGMSEG